MAALSNAQARHPLERGGQRRDRRLVEQHARFVLLHGFEGAAAGQRHHRPAARLRLDRHDTEVFFAWQKYRQRLPVFVADLPVRQPAEELDPRTGTALEPCPVRTVADDAELRSDPVTRGDRQLEALVRHEGRHHQKVAARRDVSGVIEERVGRRIHDRRLAIVVSPDPPRNVGRVGDEPVARGSPSPRPSAPAAPAAGGRTSGSPTGPTRSGPK